MKEEYEQMELDTRPELEKAISRITADAVSDALDMIERNCENSYDNLMPRKVRNRYEAYGVAAEHMETINGAVKSIKTDVQKLLDALPSDTLISPVEAISSIVSGMGRATEKLVTAVAVMKRTMNHLYEIEVDTTLDSPTPLEELAEQGYQEADELETEETEEDTEE